MILKINVMKTQEAKIQDKVCRFSEELGDLMAKYLTTEGCEVLDLLPVLTLMEARAKSQILEEVDMEEVEEEEREEGGGFWNTDPSEDLPPSNIGLN